MLWGWGWGWWWLSLSGCAPGVPGGDAGLVEEVGPAAERVFARDREAVLGLAGVFEVAYRYEEVAALRPGVELSEPYGAAAREVVVVTEDTGRRVVLVHLLVAGEGAGVVVVKLGRQDWAYESGEALRLVGPGLWRWEAAVSGRAGGEPGGGGLWTRTVYGADGGPGYSVAGRWRHEADAQGAGAVSRWVTAVPALAPIPRRDAGGRGEDYEVVATLDRVEVDAEGWRLEQELVKRFFSPSEPAVAREVGGAVYRRQAESEEQITGGYWAEVGPFWALARGVWAERLAGGRMVRVKDRVGGEPRWRKLHGLAMASREVADKEDEAWREAVRGAVREVLADYVEAR